MTRETEQVTKDGAQKATAGSSAGTWDAASADYDSERGSDPVYGACVHRVSRLAATARDRRLVLDAGCGTGMVTVELAESFDVVVAMDFSLESLKALRSKNVGRRVLMIQADLCRLPFREGTFDAVVCANTLQHLPADGPQRAAADELERVAKPEAPIVVSVHHYSRDKRRLNWVKEGKPGQPGIDYIFRFSRSDLKSLFAKANISGVGFYGLAKIPILGSRAQNVCARWFGRIAAIFAAGHMLVAYYVAGSDREQ